MPLAGQVVRASHLQDRFGVTLRRVAVQSVASGGSPSSISWDTQDEDTDGFWSAGATVTIPAGGGGIYAVTFRAVALVANRAFMQVVPTSGITGTPAEFRTALDVQEDRGFCSLLVPLEAADTFVCQVFHTTGANVDFTCWLACYRVSF